MDRWSSKNWAGVEYCQSKNRIFFCLIGFSTGIFWSWAVFSSSVALRSFHCCCFTFPPSTLFRFPLLLPHERLPVRSTSSSAARPYTPYASSRGTPSDRLFLLTRLTRSKFGNLFNLVLVLKSPGRILWRIFTAYWSSHRRSWLYCLRTMLAWNCLHSFSLSGPLE